MKTKNRIWVCPLTVMGLVLIFTTDCKKQVTEQILAVLSTTPVTGITKTTAVSGGNITADGGASITAYGVCWSTTPNPSITDDKTVDGDGSAQFVSSLSGLTAGTTYHVRAYATNSAGTAYGVDWSFTTYNSDAISDFDGNYYNLVTIGTQAWMAENLKTTSYRNGDPIGTTIKGKDIRGEATPKYQWAPDEDSINVATYGRLYTWYAATDIRNVCPTGSHIPTDAEWLKLSIYLGGDDVAGGLLKDKGYKHWKSPNSGATNETGFTALPSGVRWANGDPQPITGTSGHWWSTTQDFAGNTIGFSRYTYYDDSYLSVFFQWPERDGLSVRCLGND